MQLVSSEDPLNCPDSYPQSPPRLRPLIQRLDDKIRARLQAIPELIESARSALYQARLTDKEKSLNYGHVLTTAWMTEIVYDLMVNGLSLTNFNGETVDHLGRGGTISYGLADSFSGYVGEENASVLNVLANILLHPLSCLKVGESHAKLVISMDTAMG